MQLYRLIYCSDAADNITVHDVRSIVEKASLKNTSLLISGGLLYCENKFLQILEGSIFTINKLFNSILRDPRHKNINLIDFTRIKQREFEGWKMSLIFFPTSRDFYPHYIKYSCIEHFEPLSLDGDVCVALLRSLLERQKATHTATAPQRLTGQD